MNPKTLESARKAIAVTETVLREYFDNVPLNLDKIQYERERICELLQISLDYMNDIIKEEEENDERSENIH